MSTSRPGVRTLAGCIALAGLTLAPGTGCGPAEARDPRSIVLVTLDTVRADRASPYGEPLSSASGLEWLAVRGTRFEWALSTSPSTAPAHASIFTGRYPSFHSVGAHNTQYPLDDAATTLAELLAAAGHRTAAIVSNPLLESRFGFAQGFEHYDDRLRGRGVARAKSRSARDAVDRALAWLDRRDEGPFFLWLHLNDAHGPYRPPDAFACPLPVADAGPSLPRGTDHSGYRAIPIYQLAGRERRVDDYRRRYACEIAFLDAELARFFSVAERRDHLRGALVVLTADHGEALGEDDFHFAHGHGVGLDQVRVPLILAGPDVPRGQVFRAPVSTMSAFATILEFAGIAAPEGTGGGSLLDPRPGPVFVESLNQIGIARGGAFLRRDLRDGGDREFWSRGNPNSGGGTWKPLGGERLVALAAAGEAGAPEADRDALRRELDAFQRRAERERGARAERRGRELTPDQVEALIGLGYLAPGSGEEGRGR